MYDYDDSYLHSLRSRWRNVARGNLLESHYDDDAGNGDDNDDDDDDDDDDIYIMMSVCLFVTKNHHFLPGVSCNHLNPL